MIGEVDEVDAAGRPCGGELLVQEARRPAAGTLPATVGTVAAEDDELVTLGKERRDELADPPNREPEPAASGLVGGEQDAQRRSLGTERRVEMVGRHLEREG